MQVNRERLYPTEGLFGAVVKIGKHSYRLRFIDTDANWMGEAAPYRLSGVTSAGFGDGYLCGLALVNATL